MSFSENAVLTILFDGIAYGMLLFVLACGLAAWAGEKGLACEGPPMLPHVFGG